MEDFNPAYQNNKKQNTKVVQLERGKIPPQAVDLEELVIGALMISKRAFDKIEDFIRANHFYKEKHKIIFEAIQNLHIRNEAIDIATVSEELKRMQRWLDIGGIAALVELTLKVSSDGHIEYHARIILQKYIQRHIIANASALIENAYDDSCDSLELLDKAYEHLNETSEALVTNQEISIDDLTSEILLDGGKLFRKEITPGIPTPIRKLTEKMGGWRRTELIILAARPGMGKTAFALKCGWYAALNKIPVAFFSLEMSAKQLMQRIWSMECQIEGDKFHKDGLTPEDQNKIRVRKSEIGNVPFYIDDEPALSIQRLRIKAKRLKKEKGIEMIIVDYLQLMRGTSKFKEQEIAQISSGLKSLAKELNIPVIALAQLSRAVEARQGHKRPLLSDLRESGSIEQDADVVQFLYRPEYYKLKTWDSYDGESCDGQAEYIVAKNRNGALTRNRMNFTGRFTAFTDLDDQVDDYVFQPKPELPENAFDDFDNSHTQTIEDDDDDLPF